MKVWALVRGQAMKAAPYVGIVIATLLLVDLVCNLVGLFPPTPDYGDADVGWLPFKLTGTMHYDRCNLLSGEAVEFLRNEEGVRTSFTVQQLLADRESFKIAVIGDSQTDLCAPNSQVHSGILESELKAHGVGAIVLPYGVGRYSPLQEYLLYKKFLKKYAPDALLLNFYTGNDFNDLLRVDDRPHFVGSEGRYEIAKPVWYRFEDPRVQRRSRILFLLRSLADATGIRDLVLRFQFLSTIAAQQGEGVSAVVRYMNDLRKSVEPSIAYHEAFAAQFLNQQLLFHWFPASRQESLARARALMDLIRKENPNTLLIMSALPSYELVQQQPVDEALLRTLERLPVTYQAGVGEERELYEALRRLAVEQDWLFVDNLAALQQYRGRDRLYNNFDYHLLPTASRIIGERQAAVLLKNRLQHRAVPRRPTSSPPPVVRPISPDTAPGASSALRRAS